MSNEAKKFVQFHDAANFAAHLTRRLEQRMGIATDKSMVTWDSSEQALSNSCGTRAA